MFAAGRVGAKQSQLIFWLGLAKLEKRIPNKPCSGIMREKRMMKRTPQQWWERFQRYYFRFPQIGLSMDLSRMNFAEDFFESMSPKMQSAFAAMAALERGAIANPDENRMVGHYWLRNPATRLIQKSERKSKTPSPQSRILPLRCTMAPFEGLPVASKTFFSLGLAGQPWGRNSFPMPWATPQPIK